ncbi:hypothetical protein EZV62_014993 [Acer yangbiense]|uniref:Uncharacterized protein n=1 Tax=Acer yangbiense TaxID=1000413 RepID=A0A5C7HU24_9ROSI|nr:hypothetical protein EZV62_014993 [Acer yangbiense]
MRGQLLGRNEDASLSSSSSPSCRPLLAAVTPSYRTIEPSAVGYKTCSRQFDAVAACLNLSLYGHSEQIMDGKASTQLKGTWKEMGAEERKAAVNDELKRMNQLPANSSYVIHRLRVLNKILQLISLQRTASQEEELELLFSGLSI